MDTNKKINVVADFFKTLSLWIMLPVLMLRDRFPSDLIWKTAILILAFIAISMYTNSIYSLFKDEKTSRYFKPKLISELFPPLAFIVATAFLWYKGKIA